MGRVAADFPSQVWDGSAPGRVDRDQLRAEVGDVDQLYAEMVAVQEMFIHSAVNANAGALVAGCPLYIKSDGTCDKGDANGSGIIRISVGLSIGAVAIAGTAKIQVAGILTLTTAEWDAVAGTTGGLSPGSTYYVSGTAGALTATKPATTGDTQLRAGVALSSTKLLLQMHGEPPVA